MKFYYHPASNNCRKVDATLRYLDINAERITVDLFKGAHRADDYLAINPNGKVPALVDGAVKLWESNAIICYLAEKEDSPLFPARSRSEVLRWMFWETAHLNPATSKVVYEKLLKPMRGGTADLAVVEAGTADFRRFAAVLDTHLDNRAFVAADGLTLADFSLGAALTYATAAGLPLEEFAHVARWFRALDEIPAWKATAPTRG